ncbi:hypothetical protein CKY47_31555 [Saccharothrix yanglingensis]|uniref:DUF664 domain-containing protein n=1 Tax=Saccharothrix yanglingensis TaxID=659496 RepID=A0ABU0X8F1_9PSEU|nr:hypothetical protein [Saccharothrix yanglingensis]
MAPTTRSAPAPGRHGCGRPGAGALVPFQSASGSERSPTFAGTDRSSPGWSWTRRRSAERPQRPDPGAGRPRRRGRGHRAGLDGRAARFDPPLPTGDTGFRHGAGQVPAVTAPADLLLDHHQAVHDRTAYLRDLVAEDPPRGVDESWDSPVALVVRLVSVIGDAPLHVGQAAFARGVLPARRSRPRRRRTPAVAARRADHDRPEQRRRRPPFDRLDSRIVPLLRGWCRA